MRYFLIVLFTVSFLLGYGNDEGAKAQSLNQTISKKDSVKIKSVTPDITKALKVGDTVKIKYEVEYKLNSAESGSLVLVVQGASNETLGNEFYAINKGSGTETLETEIVVPDTRAVQVFIPLSPQGSSSTTVVDSRLYKVER